MIDLAVKHGCPIIIKSGKNGKWYLKGNGYTIKHIKNEINIKSGKFRDGVYCLLLE